VFPVPQSDVAHDEVFGRLLAEYDDALATGTPWYRVDMSATDLDREILARLEAAKDLLLTLEQVWPRRTAGSRLGGDLPR